MSRNSLAGFWMKSGINEIWMQPTKCYLPTSCCMIPKPVRGVAEYKQYVQRYLDVCAS